MYLPDAYVVAPKSLWSQRFLPSTVPGGAAQEGGEGTPEVSTGATAKRAHHRSGERNSNGGSR